MAFIQAITATGRPRNRSVALAGHSMLAKNSSNTATERSKFNQGIITVLQFLCRQSFDFDPVDNYAVSGYTSAQALATIPTLVANSSAGTVVLLPCTNDRAADYTATGVASGQSAGGTDSIVNVDAMIGLLRAAGKLAVIFTDPPRGYAGDTTYRLTATRLKQALATRKYILSLADQNDVFVVDTWPKSALANSTTGDCLSALFLDGLHQNFLGAYNFAVEAKPVFDFLFPPRPFLLPTNSGAYDATYNPKGCLNANPVFDRTSGTKQTNGSGNLADSWAENTNPGFTRVYSKVTSGGKDWQQVVLGGTDANTGATLTIRQTITAGNLTIGDRVQASIEFEWDADVANVITAGLQMLDNSVNACADMKSPDGTMRVPAIAMSGVMRTPVMTLVSTTLQIQVLLRVVASSAPAGTLRFRNCECAKV